ncbi:MAG: ZIP family metal transporter [Patescibacteria group bacterium]
MITYFWAIGATLFVSVVSFIGIIGLMVKEKVLDKILLLLVGFSAGSLLGGALLHLVPEAVEAGGAFEVFIWVLIGFTIFFVIERVFHWHHNHKCKGQCDQFSHRGILSKMNLIGDGFHNFIDGLVIAAAFTVDIHLGLITSLAVITHEIPQEISDFGVLIYGGLTKRKALIFNFLSALLAVAGAIVGLMMASFINGITSLLLAITAGGFIYISASDLIPEVNKEVKLSKSFLSFVFFILGMGLMYILKLTFEA